MDIKEKIGNDLALFKTNYDQAISNLYGPNSLMQKQFLENERDYKLTPNPAYLEMAQDGLNITKDIVSYEIKKVELEAQYRSDITDANTNIKKLEVIKDQVSEIIKKAQARRLANRAKILADYNSTYKTNITADQYDKCIKEENVAFYEDTDIFNTLKGGSERCSDGIDNDLNGLVDSIDPACKEYQVCAVGSTDPACELDNFDRIQPVFDPSIFNETEGLPENQETSQPY